MLHTLTEQFGSMISSFAATLALQPAVTLVSHTMGVLPIKLVMLSAMCSVWFVEKARSPVDGLSAVAAAHRACHAHVAGRCEHGWQARRVPCKQRVALEAIAAAQQTCCARSLACRGHDWLHAGATRRHLQRVVWHQPEAWLSSASMQHGVGPTPCSERVAGHALSCGRP